MNAYINQAARPKPLSGMQIGQPIKTTIGPGRIVNIERANTGGIVNPFYSSPSDPFLVTIQLDADQSVVSCLVSMTAFHTFNGALPFVI